MTTDALSIDLYRTLVNTMTAGPPDGRRAQIEEGAGC